MKPIHGGYHIFICLGFQLYDFTGDNFVSHEIRIPSLNHTDWYIRLMFFGARGSSESPSDCEMEISSSSPFIRIAN